MSQVKGSRLRWRQVEKRVSRWRGAIAGGGERSQVEGSDRRWRGAMAGKEVSYLEGSGLRWRGAVSGGGENSQVKGAVSDEGEWSHVEGSDRRWRRE